MHHKFFIRILLISIYLSSINVCHFIYSQQLVLEWSKRYNGSSNINDYAVDMVTDTLGNVYVTGGIGVIGQNQNFITIKYNMIGQLLWSDIYNGIGTNSIDIPNKMFIDKNNNVYVTGHSESDGVSSDDFLTIKYSPNGTRLWVARYNSYGVNSDYPYDIKVDNNGNVYVTGTSYNSTYNINDALTLKYDPAGSLLWFKRFNPVTNRSASGEALVLDNQNNIYVAGHSLVDTLTLIKYDTFGNLLWYNFGLKSTDAKLDIDYQNNLYIGATKINNQNNDNYLIVKYSNDGQLIWNKQWDSPNHVGETLISIAVNKNNNNIYLTGYGAGNYTDYVTVAYNLNGDTIWSRRYNGTGNRYDYANYINYDQSGNIYVTGRSDNTQLLADATTIRYKSNGDVDWIVRYSGRGGKVIPHKLGFMYVYGGNFDSTTQGI